MASTITKFAHLQIPLEDVLKATDNFHDDNIIGHGGFGPAYKGQLLRSGQLMKISAVRLDRKHGHRDVEFWTEISVLSDLKHTNLVSIIGFCDEKDEKILVTTYDARGSLSEHLKSPNLTWTQRLRISVGVVRALSYLHHEEGRSYAVIHRNLNSVTILLDDNWEAKLSGFMYSVKQSVNRMEQDVVCEPIGTYGYVDPTIEHNKGVTPKLDIYSLGVILFEILCGRRAYIEKEVDGLLAPLAIHHYENKTLKDIIHPDLWSHMSPKSLFVYSKVAYSCFNEERAQRPDTKYIVDELEKALEVQLRRENLGKNLEHLKIDLSDIKLATDDFSQKCLIGLSQWYFAYSAELDHSDKKWHSSIEAGKDKGESTKRHNNVVIKRVRPRDDELGEDEFYTSIEMLTSVKHNNIVTLHGFCVEGSESIFVTENISNGLLGFHYLRNVDDMQYVLTWEKRLKICIDVAHALNYLHSGMEDQKIIINCGIQSNAIGLDENWGAKIIEFGISVFLPPNQEVRSVNTIVGPKYYRDPEFEKTGMLRRESDVYGFGVVLLEILCGRLTNDPIYLKESKKGLAALARQWHKTQTLEDMIDPIIKEEFSENKFLPNKGANKDSLHTIVELANHCVAETQDQRPTMKLVIEELEKALKFQESNKDNLRMSLEKVKVATQNFHDDNHIGDGGAFRKVYKGKVPQGDGFDTIVAKRFDTRHSQGEPQQQQFFNELQILCEYKHENIIGLVGYCDEQDEKIIVYEYASRGSLDRYLNDASLTWMIRLNICIDVASALDFLHGGVGRDESKVMIHRDIKTANILLNDDWKPKLASFGRSLINPQNQETDNVIDHVCGTHGYLDPQSGFLTKESDIYSFGVVLFEILCGRSTLEIYKRKGHHLSDFVRKNFEEGKHDGVVFEQIKKQIVPNSLTTFQKIAYRCLNCEREQRPTTKEVLVQLKKALEFQEQIQRQNMDQKMDQVDEWHQKILENQGNNLEHLKIPLADIKLATGNFSETYEIRSWDDSTLYRAELGHFDTSSLEGKTTVVIKRYPSGHAAYQKAFLKEIEMLTCVKHRNIATLLGLCVEDSEMILITDNVSNGYLAHYLGNFNYDKRCVLTWEKRLKICIDVAHALNYLHYEMEDQKTVVNRDICCYNIGLDDNWGAKIVHFFWSVFLPPFQEEAFLLNHVIGRPNYTDPEYQKTSKIKRESDVYGFGVVLFEILCGRRAADPIYEEQGDNGLAILARQRFFTGTLEDMIDPIIKEETGENNFHLNRGPTKDSLQTFIKIAHQCVAETQDQRPTMRVVVQELEKALLFQKIKDNPRISIEDIKVSTQNFHNDNRIGRGGFGSVFKGSLKDRSKTIAAKRLDTRRGQGERVFLTELQILLGYKHENVIGLVGYCDEKNEKIIVYEYASKGSLDKYLNDASLKWMKRLNICIDVASALYFLHAGVGKQAKVIHRDIKAANILLNDDWKAKLSDFGLSLISPLVQETDYVIDHWCGTPGYMDPLYEKSGFLTIESDIYSFGVVLFEILCGTSTFEIEKKEHHQLADFVKNKFEKGRHDEVVFKQIREQILPKSLTTFQDIAYKCLHHEREKRPKTKEVLLELKKALEFQNMASTIEKSAHLQIPHEDIVKATNNFHDDNIIRHGGSSSTYKGQLLRSGTLVSVAARRFDYKHEDGYLEFLREISVLSDLKQHTNLVSIIGFCYKNDEKIIVTKHEAKGSLGVYLNNQNLTWAQRLRICLGVARALSYLHYEEGRNYGIIHCNINSDTILLDEHWEAKLSGFENSIKQDVNYNKDQVCVSEDAASMGSIDPEIKKTGGVTHKSDIYSFGVVLFEVLCGRRAIFIEDEDKNRCLVPFAVYSFETKILELIYPSLQWNQASPHSILKYSTIAYSCVNEDPAQRPNMEYIIEELEKALELQLRVENIGENLERLKIRLSDITLATDNFSEIYEIASWDHSTWYRADLAGHFDEENPSTEKNPTGKKTVVMKRYPSGHAVYGEEAFFTEIEMLTRVKHPNIVTLLGFCVEGSEMIVVIDNVYNGYLGHHYLRNDNNMHVLTWEKRLKICIDVARALKYLHFEMEDQMGIINLDINSRNIALDVNFGAKIVDFWWSVFMHPNQEDEALCLGRFVGRRPYIDPEYVKTGKVKRESDVYSFGVVLFEILCDKRLYSVIGQKFCTQAVEEMIDPIIKEETGEFSFVLNKGPNKDSLHTFIEIAQQCVAETQEQRPTMKDVVEQLEKALYFQENNKDNPRISLEDVKMATQNFHDDNCIGEEGFRKIYKGNLIDGDGVNTIVAKRFDKRSSEEEQQFLNELRILWEYKHENIIGLVGYSDENDEKIIVYEYASRGSLDRYLNDASFTWIQRLNICIDVASALEFLHGGVGKQAKVIHRDIKTANILLNDDWKPKLAGFGVSLTRPVTPEETNYVIDDHACGTLGYVDPLYEKSGVLTIESDIYSFGVILFEVLCGRSTTTIHKHDGHYLADFIKNQFKEGMHDKMVFEQIREQIVTESLNKFQDIAYKCLHHEREKRPEAEEVLMQLRMAMAFQISKDE